MDMVTLQMKTQPKILQTLLHLPRFETLPPTKIFYISRNTSLDLMAELIHRVKQTNQFIMITKYDYTSNCPLLMQVLFSKEPHTYVILMDMRDLPNETSMLFTQIQLLLCIILCPCNFIQSWGDIKMELRYFLIHSLFSGKQIEQMQVVNIQQKFKRWFDKMLDHTEECYELYDDMNDNSKCICLYRPFQHTYDEWSLQMAIGFTFQTYFETSFTYANWRKGFLQLSTPSIEEIYDDYLSDIQIQNENRSISILHEYVIQECLAIHKLTTFLQNILIRKHTEELLKNYYSNLKIRINHSMSERKYYKEEDEKLLNLMRQCRSQPIPQGQFRESTPIDQHDMRGNVPEIIYLPTSNQQLNSPSSWSELDQTAATIRNSPSSFRVLVQSSTGHSYVSIVDPNSSTTDQNHRDASAPTNSTSSWPV